MQQNDIKISIITVSFNSVDTIERTILSVINQSYDNMEYIIIDGGSTDGTTDIIKKYEKELAYYVSEPDDGLYHAMNKGIEHVTGDVVGILNSDDWYEEETLSKVAHRFQSGFSDVVYGNVWEIMNDGKRIINNSLPLDEIWVNMAVRHPASFVRTRVFHMYGNFDTRYRIVSDYDFMLRLYENGAKFDYLDDMLTNFRWGGISYKQYFECTKETREVSLAHLDKCPHKESALVEIEDRYKRCMFNAISNERPTIVCDFLREYTENASDDFAIFGSGRWGSRIEHVLRAGGISTGMFIDNNKARWGMEIDGTLVSSPDALKDFCGCVVIAIKDHDEEIIDQLSHFNNENLKWITLDELKAGVVERV